MKLCDLYRAGDVNRWQIIKTARPQSVAEHSFGVAMLADRLGGSILAGTGMRGTCVMWALWHDLPEVFTGDIATPLKQHIRSKASEDPFEEFEGNLCGHEYTRIHRAANVDRPEIAAVVKLADLIESVKFLAQNAMTDHGRQVEQKLTQSFQARLVEFHERWPKYRWHLAQEVFNELFAPETHLDDLL